jgi:phage/plasmid-like protein (TIGR03299 family)
MQTLSTLSLDTVRNSVETLGRPVDAMTWQDALGQSGLDWTVTKRQHLSPIDGQPVASWGIYRDDNAAFLGQVGAGYTAVQNAEQFAFADDLIATIDGARYVAAGAIGNGERVFAVAHIANFEVGTWGDLHDAYLVISDWKNALGALRAQISIFRKVCSNGMHRWMVDSAMRFRHTRNVKSRMVQASLSAGAIGNTIDGFRGDLNLLVSREITKAETVQTVLDRLFPATPAELAEPDAAKRDNFARFEAQRTVAELFADNDAGAFPSEARTAYALYNAYTRYTDHFATPRSTSASNGRSDDDRRATSALFGNGSERKARAMDIILEETAVGTFERRPVYSAAMGGI